MPDLRWKGAWMAALALAGCLLFLLELLWRANGHNASVVDDMDLWAVERDRIERTDDRPVVLLGFSRLQLGFDTATFRERFKGHDLAHLAVNGKEPMATLRDLAAEPNFRGILISDVIEPAFNPEEIEFQEPWVRHFHETFTLNDRLDRETATFFESRLALLNPRLSLLEVMLAGGEPRPWYITTLSDRSEKADYTKVDLPRHRAERLRGGRRQYETRPPPTPEQWLANTEVVERWVDAIQGRGGRVVFVRFPTGDDRWALDEQFYPRAQYWDVWAARTQSLAIHFQDEPGLRGYECPDSSHLDAVDAPRFTRELLELLVRRKVIAP